MGKIYIGEHPKEQIIEEYIKANDIQKVFVVGEDLEVSKKVYFVPNKEVICYKWFYPLLQEIDDNSLLVLNSILTRQQRNHLDYNCIRHYCQNTSHILVFNYYPIIDSKDDFMILYDMIQENPFYKESYKYIIKFENVVIGDINTNIAKTDIEVDGEFFEKYEKEKESAIAAVKKDPDIIARRLLRLSEKENKKHIKEFDKLTERKPNLNVVVNNSKVDQYFYKELLRWREEIDDVKCKVQ